MAKYGLLTYFRNKLFYCRIFSWHSPCIARYATFPLKE